MRFDGKSNRQILKSIRMSEYSAVTEPAHEGADAVLWKRKGEPGYKKGQEKRTGKLKGPEPSLAKGSALLLTSSDDEHQHILRIWDDERGGTTGSSVITIEGAGPSWHDHPWIINSEGEIEIGEVLGHSHDVDQEDVMAAILSFMKGGDAVPNQPSLFGKGKETEMAAPKKTDTIDAGALQKNLDRANAVTRMPAAHIEFWKTLEGDAANSFVDSDETQRESAVAEFAKKRDESNPVLYKAKDGTEYRSDQPDLAKFAKRDDEREAEMAKMRDENETVEFQKRAADEFAHLPGSVEHRGLLMKAISSIDDEEARGTAYLICKAKSDARGGAFVKRGHTGQDEDNTWDEAEPSGDAEEKLEKLAKARADEKGETIPVAMAKVLETDEGKSLYGQAYPADI